MNYRTKYNNFKISKIYIIIIFFIIIYENNETKENKPFEEYFKDNFCEILTLNTHSDCLDSLFTNYNFFSEWKEISQNRSILKFGHYQKKIENLNASHIENLLLLIGVIPFLKNKSSIYFQINNKNLLDSLKGIFTTEKIKNNIIKFTENDFYSVEKLINLLNYKWEIIPSQNIINIIRHIIDNYYDESLLKALDDALNLNFNYYIKSNLKSLSEKESLNLMSKSLIFLFNINFNRDNINI